MTAKNEHAARIAAALHATRSSTPLSPDNAREVALTFQAATHEEIALGTAAYFHDVLDANMRALNAEHQALSGAKEFKDSGGVLH